MRVNCASYRKSLIAFFLTVAALSTSAAAGPQVLIVNPTVNFGRVTQNKIVTTSCYVKSVGNVPLKVTMLWSGCGCTEIELTDSTIQPGDSLRLPIRFSTGRMQGPVVKTPEIQTSASNDLIKLSILADVIMKPEDASPVVMLPDIVDVSQYGEKTRRMDKFSFQNKSAQDLQIVVADSSYKSFEIKVPPVVRAGETVEGRLRVRDDRVTKDFEESVIFVFKGKSDYYYTLPVFRRYRPAAQPGQ